LSPFIAGKSFEDITGDPEYGWPKPIEMKNIKTIYDVVPMSRKHPLVTIKGAPKAISIQCAEFDALFS